MAHPGRNLLVHLGAVARVFLPLAAPELALTAIVASGLLWSAAFTLVTIALWPMLTRPRLDGKPG